ncbi:MAG: DNA polymerase III subunit alpha [Deltaproteobacteria bacterium]|nr:DNA polymerase III subunit alpha [Deltaproteobacteria bacterium]
MRQADFVHLHLHSAYSLLQSTIRLPQLVKKAREYRLPALAITDHGNLFGCIEFYDLAYSNGIKPIIGCELGVDSFEGVDPERPASSGPANHLVLLARNRKGYQNLLQLITNAHSQGWQQEARVSRNELYDQHRGLIILSGCQGGEIATLLSKDDHKRAKARAAEYLEIFGREDFFIELQPVLTDPQRLLNERLLALARQLDVQVVATANSHTLEPGEVELINILKAIRLGTTVKEIVPAAECAFLSPEEMKVEFSHLPEAVAATVAIAERCNLDLDLGKIRIPRFPLEKGQEAMALLGQKAWAGLQERLLGNQLEKDPDYSHRLESELKKIEQLGLADYFLLVADFVQFARTKGVPVGPGSGSAGSSLTAYALGITKIDPLKHGLLFERLINPLSPEFPDMELGFGMEMREEVHQYLRSKYGQDRVAQICSLVTMQLRTAIRDLSKAFDLGREDLEASAESPESARTGARSSSKEHSERGLSAGVERRVMELAAELEGLPRQVSTHATGLIIGDGPLVQDVPLYRGSKDEWVSQYNVRALKRVGLVKIDLIARKSLTVIRKVVDLVGDEYDLPTALVNLSWDDESAFALLCLGKVGGIPYLEAPRARDLLLKWQPEGWEDLLALLALIRPVALESGLTENLLSTRGQPGSQESTSPSNGKKVLLGAQFLLFDVDLIKLIAESTGWSVEKADEVCRTLIRAEEEALENIRVEFIKGAENRGSTSETAEITWSEVESSAAVVANKNQKVAQAFTVLQAAFLKARFPQHYMAALLSSELHQYDLLTAHIESCRQEGLVLLPPDINESEVEFRVEKEGIRVGLAAIRHVSRATAAAIVRARREKGPFSSLFELCTSLDREDLDKRALDSIIKAGGMDSFGLGRQSLHRVLPELLDQARRGQMALFDSPGLEPHPDRDLTTSPDWDYSTKLAKEKEVLGFYLSGHPLAEFRSLLEKVAPGGAARLSDLAGDSQCILGGVIEEIRIIKSRKGEPLYFLRLEDYTGFVEVIVFADVYAKFEKYLFKGGLALVRGRIARELDQVRLVAEEVMFLEEAAEKLATSVRLHLSVEGFARESLGDLQQLIKSQPGPCPVYLHFNIGQHTEVIQKLPTPFNVYPDRDLIAAITERFGEGCLEIRYTEEETEEV